jgi:Ca-activated chloride channel family protein
MSLDKKKYTYLALALVLAIAFIWVACLLVIDGKPMQKSQNEYLKEANMLHADSLYDEAVEPYMKALEFSTQRSLANYNAATNSLLKNYEQMNKAFNEEGYQLSPEIGTALSESLQKLEAAAKSQTDTARYSAIYHNAGVALHMIDSLSQAAEAYKEALRKNPADEDARYNLAVAMHQMKNNCCNQRKEEKEEKEEEKKEQQEQQQEEEQKKEIESMEQMLRALMQDEKEIREKMDKAEQKTKRSELENYW